VGTLYQNGWGVARNIQKALLWFRLAGEAGYTKAKHEIDLLADSSV